jgi:hypothetical protein
MRLRLNTGVPGIAGLAAGGYALSQGEDPGSAALAGIGGALGGAAGLLGARKFALAGKYGPGLSQQAQNLLGRAEDSLSRSSYRVKNDLVSDALLDLSGAAGNVADRITPRTVGKVMAGGLVPGSAALAGLGGVALGAIPGAMGMPGFQQQAPMDPESYGSSNSMGARYKQPTMQYV